MEWWKKLLLLLWRVHFAKEFQQEAINNCLGRYIGRHAVHCSRSFLGQWRVGLRNISNYKSSPNKKHNLFFAEHIFLTLILSPSLELDLTRTCCTASLNASPSLSSQPACDGMMEKCILSGSCCLSILKPLVSITSATAIILTPGSEDITANDVMQGLPTIFKPY